ncbi:sulfatase family protein [Pontiella sulfatireligans]|uniref:Arylsulfatase n=1 Tax=Pontiella sulfatireligans TaxID=2750658 RepID=A0A6C2UGU4_9BACT|nr:sulfatase [Pontiella sulfatireligans]SPS74238.1 sulfatase S1_8 [Kiritimatiellales bacterium]VGO18737.1 Arylsulfatase [Pontiella sulfatireligans]
MKIKRIKRSGFLSSALVALSFLFTTQLAAQDSRPNFVYIIGDDISQEDFGCYGHPTIRTPNVDLLAATGMRFDNAYLSTSQCSPSRCSIITGRYPHNAGSPELYQYFGPEQVVFPELLKNAGYYTAQSGKWHLGKEPKRGFTFTKEKKTGAGGEDFWVQVLQERPKDKPFFMWFAAHDAHRGWNPDKDGKPHTREEVVVPPYLYDCPEMRDDLAKYYDEIQRFDRYIGLVVDELKKQGVYENTCIIVMADNARAFPRCKVRLYDSGLKTPFVVNWPAKVKGGQVCESLVSSIDVAPSLIEAAGLKSPVNFQGVSFEPLLKDPTTRTREFVFGEHNWHGHIGHERMVRKGDYVYIRNAHPELIQFHSSGRDDPGIPYFELANAGKLKPEQMDSILQPRPSEELFKLSNDPNQFANLAGNPEYSQVLKEMQAAMDEWQQRTGDTVPVLKDATPDKSDRITNAVLIKGARPKGDFDYPGKSTQANLINDPGPR